jgi:hypothetical protein
MKTLNFYIMAASILAATTAVAQYTSDYTIDERNNLQIGIKAGFNNSNLYDTKGQDFVANPIFGPVFGGFLSIPIGKYLGVQPEVLYSARGYAGSGTLAENSSGPSATTTVVVKGNTSQIVTGAGSPNDAQNYSFIDRMNFLDVPVMLQFKPFPGLYLLGGPEYSYLLSRSYTFTQGITSETTQQEFNNDNIRHNVFGLIFGIDLNLSHWLTFGGRVAWDEQDNSANGTSTMPQYRNFWGQATVAYRF